MSAAPQHNYVVTAQKPTAVSHSVVGHFTSPTDLSLIIAKYTRIEIHLITPDGLQPLLDVPVYGRIATLELFSLPSEEQDLLFISTERYKFCALSYNAKTAELETRAYGDVKDKNRRPSDHGQFGVIDPEARVIGLHMYNGHLKTIPIDHFGSLREAFNVRLEELQVITFEFLHGYDKPVIALVHEDTKQNRHLKTYDLLLREKELRDGPFYQDYVEPGVSLIIPIPKPWCGLILVGEQTIAYHNGRDIQTVSITSSGIRALGKVDADGSRYLLGANDGQLLLLVLEHSEERVTGLKVEHLGETSIASTLTYLDNGVFYVGSCFGDSQLARLRIRPDKNGSYVEILENYTNLGPITDMCVVDLERQGQGQVITCSGAFQNGSLRIIRNGIGIHEQATVELEGIKGLWSLSKNLTTPYHDYLVVTFVDDTRILAINEEDELEEVELEGVDADLQTLYTATVCPDRFIQVTAKSVRLLDISSGSIVQQWSPPAGLPITVASGSNAQLLLATGGGSLVYFEFEKDKITEVKSVELDFEISCLDISPLTGLSPDSAHDEDSSMQVDEESQIKSTIAVIGLWTTHCCQILKLPSLEIVTSEKLGEDFVPRSVLLATLEGVDYVFCAMGDGHLLSFGINRAKYSLTNRKKIALGTQPITLKKFSSKSMVSVFASGDRPTVIYSSNCKLLYSNVNVPGEVSYMTFFNCKNFPDSLGLAFSNSLMIGTIDEIQKLHIKTVPMKEQPRRIAHSEQSRTFAVVSVSYPSQQNHPQNSVISEESNCASIKLFDDQTFTLLSTFELEPNELCTALSSGKVGDDPTVYYTVGTAFINPEEADSNKGRILVFAVKDRCLELVCEKDTKGAVYNLSFFAGKILAGINAVLYLYKMTLQNTMENGEGSDLSFQLIPECGHEGHIIALYVRTRGHFIVVGDLMKSVSLLMYKAAEETIEEIARDFDSNWMTAVEMVDDETIIGAEASFNLFCVRKNAEAETEAERSQLTLTGDFHLGEVINIFRHGSLVMHTPETDTSQAISCLIYGTVNGVIGIVASIPDEYYQFFQKLETAMESVIRGVGGFSHKEWRSFCSDRKESEQSSSFIDGDLIESFLDLKKPRMEEIATKISMPLEEIIRRVEDISRLH